MAMLFFMILEVGVAGVDDRPLVLFVSESRGRLYAFKRWIAERDYRFTKLQLADMARRKGVQCIFPSSLSVTKTALRRRLEKTGLKLGKAYAAVNLLPPRLREAVRGREWVAPRRRAKPEPAKLIDPKLPHYVFRHTLYTVEERSGSEAVVFRNKIIVSNQSFLAFSLDKRFPPHEVALYIAKRFDKYAPLLPKVAQTLLEELEEGEAEFLKEVAAILLLSAGVSGHGVT
ncbi:MAG: hypothetical protein QXJ21_09590 [Thermofilum sp.]